MSINDVAIELRNFEDCGFPKDAVDGFFLIAYREMLVQEQLDGLYLEEAGGLLEDAMENFRQLQFEEMNAPQPTFLVFHSGQD